MRIAVAAVAELGSAAFVEVAGAHAGAHADLAVFDKTQHTLHLQQQLQRESFRLLVSFEEPLVSVLESLMEGLEEAVGADADCRVPAQRLASEDYWGSALVNHLVSEVMLVRACEAHYPAHQVVAFGSPDHLDHRDHRDHRAC